jgi:pimeloyl-ACP methyl ester carboxylesterase
VRWILEDENLEDARLVLISYDAHMRKTSEAGRMDMYNTSENLISDLMAGAQVGQDRCPVILIGHSLGGLLMKELCVQAQVRLGLRSLDRISHLIQNFLANVQGFFCYKSPHHGTELAHISTFSKGPLFEGLDLLNNEAERRNEHFLYVARQVHLVNIGIGELHQVKLARERAVRPKRVIYSLKILDNNMSSTPWFHEIR